MTFLEICVDSIESAVAAERGGAHRVELCSALLEGGLTPSLGLIRGVRSHLGIGVHVMIRPRGGDFLYSADEVAVMRDDIELAARSGADGVVLGLLTTRGDVDVQQTRELVEMARPMEVTFHRALDTARDLGSAFEDVIRTGADRVLTSGGERNAMLGRQRVGEFVRAAGGRIRVMVGGGVRAENVREIARGSGALEFHSALRHTVPSPIQHGMRRVHLGDPSRDDSTRSVVQTEDVRSLQAAIEAASRERAMVPEAANAAQI